MLSQLLLVYFLKNVTKANKRNARTKKFFKNPHLSISDCVYKNPQGKAGKCVSFVVFAFLAA